METPYLSVIISTCSVLISLASVVFAVMSWHRSNRPIISARITTAQGGNVNIMLNILVENTGNRPAKGIKLVAERDAVQAALENPSTTEIPIDAQRCFFEDNIIPVLANGRSATNAFGLVGTDGVWRAGAKIPLRIEYQSLEGRCHSEEMELILADDAGFAQTFWNVSPGQ